jgi:hypothetical protein
MKATMIKYAGIRRRQLHGLIGDAIADWLVYIQT